MSLFKLKKETRATLKPIYSYVIMS